MSFLVHKKQSVEQLEDIRGRLMDHREDDAPFEGQLLQQVHDVLRIAGAEAARGFVHEEYTGLAYQLQCDVQPLPLPSADGLIQCAADLQVLRLEQAKALQHGQHALFDLLAGPVTEAELCIEEEVLENGKLFDQQVVLADVTDDPPDTVRLGMDINPVDGNGTF